MKVALITSWLNRVPNKVTDSTGIFVKEQAKAMQKLGIEVAILSPDLMPHRDLPLFSIKKRFDTEGGIPSFRIQQFHPPKWTWVFLKSYIKKSMTLYDDYFAVYGRPDLIHAHNYWVGFVAQAIKQKHGIPFVFTEHDTVFFEGKFRPWLIPLLKKMLQEADAITTVSEGLKDVLMPFAEKPIRVVPNVINTKVFKLKATIRPEKTLKQETEQIVPYQFVSVGKLSLYKGYDLLLAAFAQFFKNNPNVPTCLSIIGTGKDRQKLERQALQLGISQYITFKGQLSILDVVKVLSESDVFVSSSRFETFGVAMGEAMAMGLPILATPTDGAKYILTNETGILTPTFSVSSITQGLEKMYNEYHKFDALKIRQHVLDNFDDTIVAQQYLNIYNQIIFQNG